MPDLKTVVQRMIDAGESEEAIASVIQHIKAQTKPEPISNEPSDYTGGVMKSLFGGEALKTGLKGAEGYLKGATIDLPSSIAGGISSIYNALSSPIQTMKDLPGNVSGALSNIKDTTMMAGSQPESFGRMMGHIAGQPLATAGLVEAAPSIMKAAGTPIAAAGGMMQRFQPVSGMLPRIIEGRTMRNIEKIVGGKVKGFGERLKSSPIEGEVIQPPVSDVTEGQFTTKPSGELPPSNTSFYSPESTVQSVESNTPNYPPVIPKELPPASSIQLGGEVSQTPIDMDMQSPTSGSHMNTKPLPKMRIDLDGNFVNTETGQVFDKSGGPVSNVMPDRHSQMFDVNKPALPVPPIKQRILGQIYRLPTGVKGRWNGVNFNEVK